MPVTLVFLPAADIAAYVGEGNVDMGITGQDIIAETGVEVIEQQELGFGKCTLAVQGPVSEHIDDVSTLAGNGNQAHVDGAAGSASFKFPYGVGANMLLAA